MLTGDLKELLQDIPEDMEVVVEVLEQNMTEVSKECRARVVDMGIEKTADIYPIVYPQFLGEKVFTLRIKKEEMQKCYWCKSEINPSHNYCGRCGRPNRTRTSWQIRMRWLIKDYSRLISQYPRLFRYQLRNWLRKKKQ